MKTWTFNRQFWLIQFYLWFYRADPNSITFCKLIWGILFAPVLFPFRLLGKPLLPLLERLVDRIDERPVKDKDSWERRHPKLTTIGKWSGWRSRRWRWFFLAFLVMAVYECYLNPWLVFLWAPYFLLFGGYNLGFHKTKTAQFVAVGYHAIKDKTCPQIKVK
jgi:hypothetical protein